MIKLALFDLDKTLLDDSSRLPQEFDLYRQKLEEEGVKLGIASARTFFSIAELFGDRLDRLAGTCDNGNTIFDGNNFKVLNCWKEEDIRYLISFVERDPDIGLVFSGTEEYYTDPLTVERLHSHGRGKLAAFVRDIEEAISEGKQICNCHFVCFYEGYPSMQECVEEKLAGPLQELQENWDLMEAGWGWVAVCVPGEGKAAGIRSLMREYGAGREETMVFGDSDNDSSMFREVKFSYAMKNASESAKKAAGYITEEDNNHNGALKAALERTLAEKNRD
ncbi:MAG: HAD family hydrolase [Lachnospiraceae bacterium]|nr:HAD family hydrolase [Lachnospiraceae bacterium]